MFFRMIRFGVVFLFAVLTWAQSTGTIRGNVKDDTGGVIPGATVSVTGNNLPKALTTTTQADGSYTVRNVPPGTYSLTATYPNLEQPAPLTVTVTAGQAASASVVMTVQEQKQEITVTDTNENQVSVDPANNASALVLQKEDLDALPDDPDDLQADLEALAGPAAGPGGNQIYIDGFTGGTMPPKSSIREIRINSNPFSAEFDKLGYGRIQIFTKPGTDKFHGQGMYDISDDIWNSRNPFLTVNPPFRTQMFGGNVSGPIGKHASFFFDVERRQIDDNGIITASIPTADFLSSVSYQNFYPTPQRRTNFSPRIDWQIGANNTLSMRYRYLDNNREVTHIGAFDLPQLTVGPVTYASNGYTEPMTDNEFQVVETAVINTHVVNETHFDYERTNTRYTSFSTAPELNVSQSFVAGGSGYSSAQYPHSYTLENYYEGQNYTSITWGAHVTKFGARLRTSLMDQSSPQNFNGEYAFLGGTFALLNPTTLTPTGAKGPLTSIQQYLLTQQLINAGIPFPTINSLGYGPSKFTITEGNPYIGLSQTDLGPFVQDDWRILPNLTLSLGVRYEWQTNISDNSDWAPRLGIAWAPGQKAGRGRPKLVVRAGWGYFYDRFALQNVLNARLYGLSGPHQSIYTVDNPGIYDATYSIAPPQSALTLSNTAQHYVIDNNLRAPQLMETVIGIDRQLASRTTLSINLINSRGTHELLTDDINAPLPIPGELPPGASELVGGPRGLLNSNDVGFRPYGNIGDIYDYQSVGIYKQVQAMVNVSTMLAKRLTIFSHYSYNQAHSDSDGIGTLPADPYNIAANWGRAALDIHHQLFVGGSFLYKWGIRLSPFLVIHSGIPFNVTTGTDLYLQGTVTPTARPQPVAAGTPGAVSTPIGYLNPYPLVGAPILERNFATGPGYIGFNLRASKTWGFGTTKFEGPSGGARAGGGGYGGHGGGFGGPGRLFGGESTEHRYNLTLSINARNILNHENLNTPNGALTSPYFFESTGITGGYGAEATASNQRRIDMRLQFSF